MVLKAISHNYDALGYCAEELKNDKEFILKTVSKAGRTLKFASDEIKK